MSSYPRMSPPGQLRGSPNSKDPFKDNLFKRSYDNGSRFPTPSTLAAAPSTTPFIGRSPAIKQLFSVIEKIAPTNSSVLITGATGTGKELVARTVHELSPRRDSPFVDINCSAIPDTLIEAEFFGHQRGTFTGAHETRRGLFEEATGGTLFLDEIDSLNLAAQSKLLRVLQERQLRRVGGRGNIQIDVRIVAATNRDLQAAIATGAFRADLFFRLCVIPLPVPELRERGGDIALLVEHFIAQQARHTLSPARFFSQAAMCALTSYAWPGNVRELENAVEYALSVSNDQELTVNDLPLHVLKSCVQKDGLIKECASNNAPLAEIERRYILSMFKRFGQHHINTAAALGIDRRTLYRKLRQYGVNINEGENFT